MYVLNLAETEHISVYFVFEVQSFKIVCPLQRIPTPLFVLEIWKACFTGLIESPEGTEELKWTAFTFLKVRSITYFGIALTVCNLRNQIDMRG